MKICTDRLRSPPWCPPQRGGAIMLAGGCTRPFAGAPPHPFLAPVALVFGRRLASLSAPSFGVSCSALWSPRCLFCSRSVSVSVRVVQCFGFCTVRLFAEEFRETMPPSVPRRGKRWEPVRVTPQRKAALPSSELPRRQVRRRSSKRGLRRLRLLVTWLVYKI